jgi:hypothetical protein
MNQTGPRFRELLVSIESAIYSARMLFNMTLFEEYSEIIKKLESLKKDLIKLY